MSSYILKNWNIFVAFRGKFEIFPCISKFQKFYAFIPRFLVEP